MLINPANLGKQALKYHLQILECKILPNGSFELCLVRANSGLRGGYYKNVRTTIINDLNDIPKWIKRHPKYTTK